MSQAALNIQLISASAGSGKTWKLSQLLCQAVADGSVRPEAVIATTFTRKAAAELSERVRRFLLEQGMDDRADRLGAARIGTVNSVCGALVEAFAYELGLSPQIQVLDEALSTSAVAEALSGVLTDDDHATLVGLAARLDGFDWQQTVQRILDLARANGLAADQLADCAARSVAGNLACLGAPLADGDAVDQRLQDALVDFLDQVDTDADSTKTTAGAVATARRAIARLRAGQRLPWADWVRLSTLSVAKKSGPIAAPVNEAAVLHDRHPALHADVRTAIERCFDIAARGLAAYQAHKKAWGVLDFTDQEVLALQLLEQPAVQERLADQLDLLLVDEFQDTSPVQLAIFLRLSALARRTVWVGDQKQAIFAFRGTDPALMDAAIDQIMAGAEPEPLPHSWRSRPPLVDLTSDLFVGPFADQGMPEGRVRLTAPPQLGPDDPALGAVAEWWGLDAGNVQERSHALAAATRQLLDDDTVRVRDRRRGGTRALRPGDVAILCRTNDTCTQVAEALEAQGIRAVIARGGLLSTPEGEVALAALGLFVDDRDHLAVATLGRYLGAPDDGDRWLSTLVATPKEGWRDLPCVQALRDAATRHPAAGAVTALDLALDAVGAAELCRRWGDSQQRLDNLEALRAQAVAWTGQAQASGAAATPEGLIQHLRGLRDEGTDGRATTATDDAVQLCTWHASKGLEWPVTVLYQVDRVFEGDPLGVSVVRESEGFDLADPLADRWLRLWINPYQSRQSRGVPFRDRLAASDATARAQAHRLREELRLLYVAWTRARDRIVLAGRDRDFAGGVLGLLAGDQGLDAVMPAPGGPGSTQAQWAGRAVDVVVRRAAAAAPIVLARQPGAGPVARPPLDAPPAWVPPSGIEGDGPVGAVSRLGAGMALGGAPAMVDVGEAVHGFLAADRPSLSRDHRVALAGELLAGWGVAAHLSADELVAASDALHAWVASRWPGARWRRELPLSWRRADGSTVQGFADLVLEWDGDADQPGGLVVIDHKSFPGSTAQARERVGRYAGQLDAYAQALQAGTGQPVRERWIHLPLRGIALPVGPPA